MQVTHPPPFLLTPSLCSLKCLAARVSNFSCLVTPGEQVLIAACTLLHGSTNACQSSCALAPVTSSHPVRTFHALLGVAAAVLYPHSTALCALAMQTRGAEPCVWMWGAVIPTVTSLCQHINAPLAYSGLIIGSCDIATVFGTVGEHLPVRCNPTYPCSDWRQLAIPCLA